MVDDWLLHHNRYGSSMFIIGVEANPFLVALFRRVVGPPAEGLYWRTINEADLIDQRRGKANQFVRSDTVRRARDYWHARDQVLLVNGAVASSPGIAQLHVGFGKQDDVGSIFPYSDRAAH